MRPMLEQSSDAGGSRLGGPWGLALVAALLSIVACSGFRPLPLDEVGFQERMQTRSRGGVTVSTAVLSAAEAKQAFDSKLYKKRIQPVWVEIENRTERPLLFLPYGLDPDYVPPLEAAYRSRRTWQPEANRRLYRHFYEQGMRLEVPAGSTVSGFVHAPRERGARLVVVDLVGEDYAQRFEFVVEVPGFRADYLAAVKRAESVEPTPTRELDLEELRRWIEELPCCVTNAEGSRNGDPLNLVLVGDDEAIWPAFLRAGWDPTRALTTGSALRTGLFGIFGGAWKYSPISSLYLFDRPQDIALQKVRHNIHLRNHLRLWLAPVTHQGLAVWVGQISRDIGTRLTTKSSTFTTHKIDPDVDETRSSLIQDFLYSQALALFAYADGVGEAFPEEPRGNLTGDPYFTDGLRAVLLLSSKPLSLLEVEYLEWEQPAASWSTDTDRTQPD